MLMLYRSIYTGVQVSVCLPLSLSIYLSLSLYLSLSHTHTQTCTQVRDDYWLGPGTGGGGAAASGPAPQRVFGFGEGGAEAPGAGLGLKGGGSRGGGGQGGGGRPPRPPLSAPTPSPPPGGEAGVFGEAIHAHAGLQAAAEKRQAEERIWGSGRGDDGHGCARGGRDSVTNVTTKSVAKSATDFAGIGALSRHPTEYSRHDSFTAMQRASLPRASQAGGFDDLTRYMAPSAAPSAGATSRVSAVSAVTDAPRGSLKALEAGLLHPDTMRPVSKALPQHGSPGSHAVPARAPLAHTYADLLRLRTHRDAPEVSV